MQRFLKIFFLTCAFAASVAAQIVSNSVPVRWERYKVEAKNVSALFPKLPVLLADYSKSCFGEESAQYIAYANEAVYALRVAYKVKPDGYCPRKGKFSEKNFAERLKEIRDSEAEIKEIPVAAGDRATAKFVGKYGIRLLFNDPQNNRWFELYVAARDLNKPAVNNFLESIKIGQPAQGIEIGEGAAKNYGDANEPEQKEAAKTNSAGGGISSPGKNTGNGIWDKTGVGDGSQTGSGQKIVSDPVIIVVKAIPGYTDLARKKTTQGVVRLRVIFLANGGIGSITVVDALPNGLTELAIRAAQRIFFLPPRRNQVPYPVAKVVEYRFTIY